MSNPRQGACKMEQTRGGTSELEHLHGGIRERGQPNGGDCELALSTVPPMKWGSAIEDAIPIASQSPYKVAEGGKGWRRQRCFNIKKGGDQFFDTTSFFTQ
ncbi:hypothetical protein AAHE18_14G091400 [Arachis hypogaea]